MKPQLRLAFRVEGNYWNAYVAEMATMDRALAIGSLAMTAALRPEIKHAFMDLMQRAFEEVAPFSADAWNAPRPAPEPERAGSA